MSSTCWHIAPFCQGAVDVHEAADGGAGVGGAVYGPHHREVAGAVGEDPGEVFGVYAAYGNGCEGRGAYDPAHAVKAQDRVGLVLGGSGEDRPHADVAGRESAGGLLLLLVMGGKAEDLAGRGPEPAGLG